MKRNRKLIYGLTALLLAGSPLVLTNCGGGSSNDNGGNINQGGEKDKISKFVVSLSGENTINIGQKVTIVPKVVSPVGAKGKFTYTVEPGSESIISVDGNGIVTGLSLGTGKVIVTCTNGIADLKTQSVEITVIKEAENAVGAFNYAAASYEERLNILGKIEEYAVKQHLTGLTLFENGGLILYNPRLEIQPKNYISGYGFGVVTEGKITAPLGEPVNPDKAMYYHSFAGTRNNHDFNYLDDTGSVTADLYGYLSSTYYGTKMNATKDGYDWYPLLAKENPATVQGENGETITLDATQRLRPVALNKDPATKLATKYKVFVRTGATDAGLTYKTNSKKYSSFNGRPVALEDYVTPYRLLLTQGIGLARSTDMISDTSDGTLRGAKAYYNQTKDKSNIKDTKQLFDQLVGIKTDEADNSITFTFNAPLSEFEAMTALSSSLTSPIPADFVETIGRNAVAPGVSTVTDEDVYRIAMKYAYGTKNGNGTTPVDNLLSLSPYTLEEDNDKYIAYKNNPDWFERKIDGLKHRNQMPGICLVYNSKAETSTLATWEMFAAEKGNNVGQIDAVSIPKEKLAAFKNDPRARKTQGDSTFKLNLNTCTQAEWEAIFGPEGTNPSSKGHYNVKPLMSNDNFVDALSFAIDRQEYANNRGSNPSQSYFAPAYLWEPEQGFSYDTTEQHKAAIANYSPETYGYNIGLATKLMDKAIKEEIAKGSYPEQYASTETIDIHWMNPTDPEEFGDDLVVYFNKAFERTEAKKQGFNLVFRNIKGSNNYQEVYEKMRAGHFDLGFGSISGMQLDPLGFLEVLKSNNITGFTLNYSGDTSTYDESDPNSYITYDNKKWSFDSLWTAANKGAVVGADKKVVEEPLKIRQSGTGSVDSSFKLGNETIPARQLRLSYARDIQATSTALSMKLRTSDVESVVVSISFSVTEGDKVKNKSVSFAIPTGPQFIIKGEGANYELATEGSIDILIPQQINNKTTSGQITESFSYKDIKSCVISVNYYMEIGGVTTSSTITTPNLRF